ncbi:MAG: hypothetical protein LBC79_09685 [Deltaproteobacteria bacterium]|jgi:hypothetical protein|nr:hypothetical protein [Deltaproteobacteria bacterium]
MAGVPRNMGGGRYIIVDMPRNIKIYHFVLIGIDLFATCAIFIVVFPMHQIGGLICSAILAASAIWTFVIFKVHLNGYIVDVKNDSLEFPKKYRRYKVQISEIREINMHQEESTYSDRHCLDISGGFGVHSLRFNSDDKRKEFYSTITRINKMG